VFLAEKSLITRAEILVFFKVGLNGEVIMELFGSIG